MELQHFSHYHSLIFFEDLKNNPDDYPCYGCLRQVSGPNYQCIDCLGVHLHQSCAELPRELWHPLHPQHPLLLIHEEEDCELCEGCNVHHALGFVYNCSHCNFNLDSKCASLPLTIEAENHDHPLTLMRRSVSFTCDACGKQGKGMFYSCAVCPFLVHLQCSSFPKNVKHIRHMHPLNLTDSLQLPQSSDRRLCPLCVKNVDTDNMVYYCSTCDYVNHLHCATNEQLLDETFDDTESIEPIDFFPFVLKSKPGEPVKIKHLFHDHDLKLVIDEQLENNEKCDACMWPISPPFYTCAQCRFFLHKSCVELPIQMSHPLHRHPLILLPESPKCIGSCFVCEACDRDCNAFTYYCHECNFNLDVQCSLIPDIINHDGHEHQLILSSALSYDKVQLL